MGHKSPKIQYKFHCLKLGKGSTHARAHKRAIMVPCTQMMVLSSSALMD